MSFVDVTGRIVSGDNGIDMFFAIMIIMLSAVECYSGYKAIKAIRSIYGFVFGAVIGVLIGLLFGSITKSIGVAAGVGVGAAMVFGIASAILAYMVYVYGTILFTYMAATIFGLVLFQNIEISNWLTVTISFLFGGVAVAGLFYKVRPVIVIVSAMSGALLIVNGTCVLMHLGPMKHMYTSIALWIILFGSGVICQSFTSYKTAPNMMSVFKNNKQGDTISFSERKFPGMQRAYRNYCIRCGCKLGGITKICPECGFIIDEQEE